MAKPASDVAQARRQHSQEALEEAAETLGL